MTKGNSSFGAGKQAGYDEGYADAKKDFKNETGKDFDEVFKRGKITAIIYAKDVEII